MWISPKDWRPFKHFYPSLLLFIPTITTQIYLFVNQLMLGKLGDPTALGQYNYADKIVKLVLAVVTATGTVMLPHIANKFASGDVTGIRESLYKSFDFVTSLAVPLTFGLMAISDKFAIWFLGTKYVDTGQMIFLEAPVIVFIAWSNVTGTQYLMPVNRINEYTISVTCGAIVNIIANALLIIPFSGQGAAVATTISEFFVTAAQLVLIRTTISRRRLFQNIWKYFVSGAIMFVVVFRLDNIMNMNIINLSVQVAIGALVYVCCLLILKAPIVKQAQGLLNSKK